MQLRVLISLSLACGLPLAAAELHVGTGQAHATVAAALAAAAPGDVIKVHEGIYQEGNLRIDKAVSLEGVGRPVLDGADKDEILTITAPDVSVRGFEIRNSGVSSLRDMAGIRISETSRVTVADNRIRRCTFGIYSAKSKDCVITGNDVLGGDDRQADLGNGIHFWYCERIAVRGNTVRSQRDGIYMEFTTESSIEENHVENNLRYGLHFMFSHGNSYHRNTFQRNGAGVAVMYSRKVQMIDNHFGFNWGGSSYGLLLKEMTDGRISGNTFERNTTAITMDGSNRMVVEGNEFLENGRAIRIHSNSSDNTFAKNNFSGNSFDVASEGELPDSSFAGNYWDKYEGYDLRRDGAGDVPYRPVSLYAVLVSRVPPAVLLLRSPIVHMLDAAEKAFPSITPETVKDDAPAMRPHVLKTFRPGNSTP